MKKLILFFLFVVFSFAQIKFVNVEALGYGITKEDAINIALSRAVAQVNGLSISAAQAIVKQSTKGKILVNNSKTVIKVVSKTQASSIATKAKGALQSYRIISIKPINGSYEVKISAIVAKYISPGLNPRKRRSLAVIPFRYKKVYSFDNIDISGSSLTHRLTQAIVTKITQTRKFTVLDRENSEYYNLEKNFLLSGNTDPVELARLGKRLGADYFIIGEILDFGIEKNVENISLTGKNFMQINGYATVNYRILNIPTQQIKWSDTIDINFNIPKNKKRAESIIAISCDKIAQVLVEEIIFNIYPPRIIEDNGVSVILNMGGKFIHSGDIFEVYALGKKLYDPYTKEYLGRDEIYVGKIKITKVLPKISYAKIIEGRAGKGSIVRKIKKISNQKNKTQQVEGKDSMFDTMFK
jgi:curli biogenesis system outer membrane secretion channel CsgG